MIWTILVSAFILIAGMALYVLGGLFFKSAGKNPSAGSVVGNRAISVVAVLMISGAMACMVSRVYMGSYVPYYLTQENPLIIEEMVQGAQKQQQEIKNQQIREIVRERGDELVGNAPILGNRDAEKTIYVWTAASCGYCRRVHGELDSVLKSRDDVRVVLKNFSIHGVMSDGPARAMIAAKMQDADKAAKFVDLVMTREYRPGEDIKDQAKMAAAIEKNLMKFAKEAGLDAEQLKKDMGSEVVARELRNVREFAQLFEISGTPFLIIGEQAFPGMIPASAINNALDAQ